LLLQAATSWLVEGDSLMSSEVKFLVRLYLFRAHKNMKPKSNFDIVKLINSFYYAEGGSVKFVV